MPTLTPSGLAILFAVLLVVFRALELTMPRRGGHHSFGAGF